MKKPKIHDRIIILSTIAILFFSSNLYSQMYILNEDFSSATGTTLSLEWTSIVILGEQSDVWHFDNPGGQTVGYPAIPPTAIFNADLYAKV